MSSEDHRNNDHNSSVSTLPEDALGFPHNRLTDDEGFSFATTPIRNVAGRLYGTGGFYQIPNNDTIVITCKHVIDFMIDENQDNEYFYYEVRTTVQMVRQVRFQRSEIRMYPKEDLVMILVRNIDFETYEITCINPMFMWDDTRLRPDLYAMEAVMMFGYPAGLCDEHHNSLPLIRSGYTASHPGVNVENEPPGRLNITGYTCDSGAPVMIATHIMYLDRKTSGLVTGCRGTIFLGVYTGGFHTHIKCKDDEPELPMAVGDYVKSKVLNDILQWPPYEYEKLEPEQN
jgi:hypothetical protein